MKTTKRQLETSKTSREATKYKAISEEIKIEAGLYYLRLIEIDKGLG